MQHRMGSPVLSPTIHPSSPTKVLKWLPRISQIVQSMGSPISPSFSPSSSPPPPYSVRPVVRVTSSISGRITHLDDEKPEGSLRDQHNAAGAWFLGPKAENAQYFQKFVKTILDDLVACRRDHAPEDKDFIDTPMVSSAAFKESMSALETNVNFLSALLPQHSVPFYSPRYSAHMLNDVSMPATLGYLMALMYNPNNVAVEGSPLTSVIEFDVGQQLCSMIGLAVQKPGAPAPAGPAAWGHITCDGSVANMEAIWAARNVKYYPLSLKRAVETEPSLAFLASQLKIQLCNGTEKFLSDCETWDLLNLKLDEVLSLPMRISKQFFLSPQAFQGIMSRYLIQTTGKDDLERYFDIQRPPQFLVSKTAHYSWPKGAALAGVGSLNLIGVPVDDQARLDCHALDTILSQFVETRQAVYAVVAIMGTTEHGTIDPISKILALRRKYQRRGLSFMIHADAAWGGYFTSMFVENPSSPPNASPLDDPTLFVHPYTERELRHIRFADSITVDPHKSGYVPYPAGSLCYRDSRLRYMVTWTSPVVDSPEDGASRMGIYGIEGSKPGAAPVAAWLSHEVIGLHKGGYGFLLGEAIFTSMKAFNLYQMYSHWATMSLDHPNLLVVPFRMLPSEKDPNSTVKEVDEERRFIRDVILTRARHELAQDPRACALMQQLGSDLVVNAFACNFRVNGRVNKDIAEANFLNARIYERLSFHKLEDKLSKRKVVIMSTVFSQKEYGSCLTNFKDRLGLSGDANLFVLVNVSMSPFASPINFEKVLADTFRQVAEEEVKVSLTRNNTGAALHAFILQGTADVHLVHMPCFSSASQRRQCIFSGILPEPEMEIYLDAKAADPQGDFIACTFEEDDLSAMIRRKSVRVLISKILPDGLRTLCEAQITKLTVIKDRQLNSRYLDAAYPQKMPFYLYGSLEEAHIDHMLLHAPNAQMTASNVHLELREGNWGVLANGLRRGMIAVAETYPEHLMQPFTASHRPNFFRSGISFDVQIFYDRHAAESQGPGLVDDLGASVARGTITLGPSVFVDSYMVNVDTPVIASHVPKKNFVLPFGAESLSQDHPLFRGHGPAGHNEHSSSGERTGWRNIWDVALDSRDLSRCNSCTEQPTAPDVDDEFLPSPAVARPTKDSFFLT